MYIHFKLNIELLEYDDSTFWIFPILIMKTPRGILDETGH